MKYLTDKELTKRILSLTYELNSACDMKEFFYLTEFEKMYSKLLNRRSNLIQIYYFRKRKQHFEAGNKSGFKFDYS